MPGTQIEHKSPEGQPATSDALICCGEADSDPHHLDLDALRDAAQDLTKKKSSVLQKVTGGAATKNDFAKLNNAIKHGASGRGTRKLRAQVGITGTPRDYMDPLMLHAVACQEEAIAAALEWSVCTEACKSLPVPDAIAIGLRVTDAAGEICRNSGVWGRPMLTQRVTASRRVKQAAGRSHTKGQTTLWHCLRVKSVIC